MSLDFSVVPSYLPAIFYGLLWTLLSTIIAGGVSFIGGILFAIVLLYGSRLMQLPVQFIIFLFMTTPLLLQLYMLYYGLSQLGIMLPAFWTGVVGLGLHYAVYNADVIRAAILTVDRGQAEAGRSLGFSHSATLRHFILPQALFAAVPQLGNNTIILLKDTALLSLLGITELVLASQLAISRTFRPFEFYITAAVLYYLVNLAMEWVLRRIARKTEAMR